jgi:hypothetical protein
MMKIVHVLTSFCRPGRAKKPACRGVIEGSAGAHVLEKALAGKLSRSLHDILGDNYFHENRDAIKAILDAVRGSA